MKPNRNIALGGILVMTLALVTGCQKKTPVIAALPVLPNAEVPEAPKLNAPTIAEFAVEPSSIERGQTAMLRWQVSDATQIYIDQGIGAVAATGQRRISPVESTTYALLARGLGGQASATATLAVMLPPPPVSKPEIPPKTFIERLSSEVHDVYFDFDQSNIREDAQVALTSNAGALKSLFRDFPTMTVVLEGHCDERGSAEYNIALGDRRATAAREFLGQLGVEPERLLVLSYGKERPQCTESNEDCWQRNRRAHFAPGESQRPKAD